MTCQKFDEALDQWMSLPHGEEEPLHGLSPELRRHVAGCPRCQQLRRDWLWLHRQIQATPAPAPSEGFSDRVVAAFLDSERPARPKAEPIATRSVSPRMTTGAFRWVGGVAALAASIVIGLVLLSGDPNSTPRQTPQATVASSPPATLQLPPGPVVDSLVENVSEALALGAPKPTEPTVTPAKDFPDLGIRRAFKSSTDDILETSRELTSSVQPIAESAAEAVGAFDFLWQDFTETEKPRT